MNGPRPTADGAMIADIAAHSLATAVFVSLETWMSKGGEDIDELSRLTDIALSALEDGLDARRCGTPDWTTAAGCRADEKFGYLPACRTWGSVAWP